MVINIETYKLIALYDIDFKRHCAGTPRYHNNNILITGVQNMTDLYYKITFLLHCVSVKYGTQSLPLH